MLLDNPCQSQGLSVGRALCFLSLRLFLVFSLCLGPVLAAEYSHQVQKLLDDGERFLSQGQLRSARQTYGEALSKEPNCPDALNGIGLTYKLEGNYKAAQNSYLAALKIQPDHYDSIYNLANAYYLDQDYAEAASFYLRALQVRGKPDADLLCSLATVYRDKAKTESGETRKSDWDRSVAYYKHAANLDRQSPRVPAYLGQLYVDMGDLDAAEREFKRAIALKKDYAFAYFHLGRLEQLREHLPAAIVAWHYSLKYETVPAYRDDTIACIRELGMPASVTEHFAHGYEYLANSLYDMAEAEFEAASGKANRLQAVSLNNLGYARAKQSHYREALVAYKQALKIAPHVPEIYFNIAQAYRALGDTAQAEVALNQAIAEAHGNYDLAHNALGIILKQKGNLELALKHYNFAQMQSADALSVVHLNKAVLLEQQGKKEEARQSYLAYLKSGSNGLNAEFARKHLAKLK